MATVHSNQISPSQMNIVEREHPQWIKAFRTEIRSQQLADDHQAWAAVTGVLLTIVTVGAILAVITVSICMLH